MVFRGQRYSFGPFNRCGSLILSRGALWAGREGTESHGGVPGRQAEADFLHQEEYFPTLNAKITKHVLPKGPLKSLGQVIVCQMSRATFRIGSQVPGAQLRGMLPLNWLSHRALFDRGIVRRSTTFTAIYRVRTLFRPVYTVQSLGCGSPWLVRCPTALIPVRRIYPGRIRLRRSPGITEFLLAKFLKCGS